jgi:hypothetical protein
VEKKNLSIPFFPKTKRRWEDRRETGRKVNHL